MKAVVSCANFCSNNFMRIGIKINWLCHRIWILKKKSRQWNRFQSHTSSRMGIYATASRWIDSWLGTQQILYDCRNIFLTKNTRARPMSSKIKKTNIIYNYRFVEPYTIHNITWYIKVLVISLQDCWCMFDEGNMLVCTKVCLFVSIYLLSCSSNAQFW